MTILRPFMQCFVRDERGATAVEYGLIAALIVVGVVAGVNGVADANNEMYKTIEDAVVPTDA